MEDGKKKNTFRNEIESSIVSPTEEMNRNQAVHRFYLQSRKSMMAADKNHIQAQIDIFNAMRTDIANMPDCECRTGTLGMIDNQIAQHQKALEASIFDGLSAMTLDALERLNNLTLASEGQKEVSVN